MHLRYTPFEVLVQRAEWARRTLRRMLPAEWHDHLDQQTVYVLDDAGRSLETLLASSPGSDVETTAFRTLLLVLRLFLPLTSITSIKEQRLIYTTCLEAWGSKDRVYLSMQ